MLDHGREIVAATRERCRADLDTDRFFELALARLVEILGEAATRVSVERRAAHPEIPWRPIIAMRNRLIHVYDDVNREELWRTAREDVPALVASLERILR